MDIRHFRTALSTVAAAVFVVGISGSAQAQQKTESTWELIKRTSMVRMGVFDYPPYYLRDKATGQWTGALVEMGKDIAKELEVKFEPVEIGGFGEAVLALQSSKIDFHCGLQATPKRSTAIDFAGPIYWIEWVTVNNPKFKGKTWADYNKPEVKVAVLVGSADEVILKKMAPKATRVELKELAQIILAVSSGRAEAFTTTVLSSMVAKSKNPDLGDFVNPVPRVALPGYCGIRMEDDARWQKFFNRWAEWQILLGHNEQRMKDSLGTLGITEMPSTVSFQP